LRYSDIFQLKKGNVKGEEIHFTTVKTNDKLIVPLNDYAKEILKKYDYSLPVISNQKTNKYLKEICKIEELELDEEIVLTKKRGGEDLEFIEPKYNFISTHTARRTHVTLSLEKGMRPEVVMSNTGHKDYKTFKKYIKLIPKVKLVEMKRVWNRDPLLKAV
jgi:integrase